MKYGLITLFTDLVLDSGVGKLRTPNSGAFAEEPRRKSYIAKTRLGDLHEANNTIKESSRSRSASSSSVSSSQKFTPVVTISECSEHKKWAH